VVLKIEDKKAIVAELAEVASESISVVAADYRGLTVSEMTLLRTQSRQQNVKMRVYRNTLARRAFQDTRFAGLNDALVGPIVLFFGKEEPGAPARLIRDFIKKTSNEKLLVRALALDGKIFAADQLKTVASLPSRHEALCTLVAVMKAPITKFVRTVREPVAQAVRVMAAVRDQTKATA
jgi:large subunit ribosomal protein L10